MLNFIFKVGAQVKKKACLEATYPGSALDYREILASYGVCLKHHAILPLLAIINSTIALKLLFFRDSCQLLLNISSSGLGLHFDSSGQAQLSKDALAERPAA